MTALILHDRPAPGYRGARGPVLSIGIAGSFSFWARPRGALAGRTVKLAETCPKKMANYLKAAAPYLFTFLRHKNMEGTTNPAERGVRPIVVRRKISGQMGSAKGMRGMGILFTCLLTWRKKNLDIYRELERVLASK